MENGKYRTKGYSESYLYNKSPEYEKRLFKFLMEAKEVDKKDPSFEDIISDLKRRQVHSVLSRVLMLNSVVLLRHASPLPRSFKVFAAADVKNGSKAKKIFIDVSDIMVEEDGKYKCNMTSIDILGAYLLSALCILVNEGKPNTIINNSQLTTAGTKCFSSLFTYIIDYMRLGGVADIREKVTYMSAMYYQVGILGREETNTVKAQATALSKLSARDTEILDMQMEAGCYDNIDKFISCVSKVIKADGLRLDNFMEKWMMLLGSGTQFGTEVYTAFSSMITNAYCGVYINNQKTIEKITGKNMVEYVNTLLRIGGELI